MTCFEVADTIGTATVTVPAIAGLIDSKLVLDLPLCVEHAHVLRMGVIYCDLDSHLE